MKILGKWTIIRLFAVFLLFVTFGCGQEGVPASESVDVTLNLPPEIAALANSPSDQEPPAPPEGLTEEVAIPDNTTGGPSIVAGITVADETWWRNLSQIERNQAILGRAYQDLRFPPQELKYVGLNCKDWVRRVVSDASRGVVNIPSTAPDASGWYWYPSRYTVGMSGGIRSSQPGWIIQMNWKLSNGNTTPHTAIVVGRDPNGVYLVESNWCSPACYKVGARWVSFADFEAKAVLYSSYYIIGG